MGSLERELRSAESGDTALFARVLVSAAAANLPRELRAELGADE